VLVLGGAGVAAAAPGDSTADAVLGQPGFTTNAPNQPADLPTGANLSLSNAAHAAVAPGGRLYVSDAENHRVLSWPLASAFVNGAAADRVFGQPDFASGLPNNGGVSASSFNLPQGLAVDEGGHLWVADAFNCRVLKFNNPDSDATPAAADLVIGQVNLTSNAQNLGNGGQGTNVALPDGLLFPGRVVVRGGDVWVADSGNSRVLHYVYPTANKPVADRVFGQFDSFTCRAKNNDGACNNACCASAENLFNPIGIALDPAGRLYVADWNNHRVLRFDAPLTSDTVADAVFGQPNFNSSVVDNGGPASGLELPIDLAFDPAGHLHLADSGNNRVLVYLDPLADRLPDRVFGQLGSLAGQDQNHGLGPAATDADGLFGPTGVVLDGLRNLLIVDTLNMRVLRMDSPLRRPGDLDCNGSVTAADIAPFALALVDPAGYGAAHPACDPLNADTNGDAALDAADIHPFIALVSGG
jgi:sugar lactone lactonase YvrE